MTAKRATRLHERIRAGDLEGVRTLVAAGAPLEKWISFYTAMHTVVFEGTEARGERRATLFAIAQLLLDGGADINGATPKPRTSPLQLAIPDEEWTHWLLDRGANPDLYDSSHIEYSSLPPLALAVTGGHVRLIERLVRAGAKTDIVCHTTSSMDKGLLAVALCFKQPASLAALLEHARFSGNHVREGLCQALRASDHASIATLIAHGARGDMVDDRGELPIGIAYTRKDREAIALLRPVTAPEILARCDAWVADRRGTLGVMGYKTIEEESAYRAQRGLPPGAFVRGLVDGGAAKNAGIRESDVIVLVDAKNIVSFADLAPALAGKRSGDGVTVTVVRAGEEHTFAVVLQSPSGW